MANREIRRLESKHVKSLGRLFEALSRYGYDRFFHPHPLTIEAAHQRADLKGTDVYIVLIEKEVVLAYGMLRGWDDGYEIPSVGIAVHPEYHGQGIGREVMQFLHGHAAKQGAKKIRLRVHPENESAIFLYNSLGYRFQRTLCCGDLIGFAALKSE